MMNHKKRWIGCVVVTVLYSGAVQVFEEPNMHVAENSLHWHTMLDENTKRPIESVPPGVED